MCCHVLFIVDHLSCFVMWKCLHWAHSKLSIIQAFLWRASNVTIHTFLTTDINSIHSVHGIYYILWARYIDFVGRFISFFRYCLISKTWNYRWQLFMIISALTTTPSYCSSRGTSSGFLNALPFLPKQSFFQETFLSTF